MPMNSIASAYLLLVGADRQNNGIDPDIFVGDAQLVSIGNRVHNAFRPGIDIRGTSLVGYYRDNNIGIIFLGKGSIFSLLTAFPEAELSRGRFLQVFNPAAIATEFSVSTDNGKSTTS